MSSVKNRQIIDTHCHVQMSQYNGDRDEVIHRALDAGVGMICVGIDLESSRQAIALADQYEGVWASVGLHPNDPGEVDGFEELMSHPKVVAVGEVGLDYYRSPDTKEIQKERLKKFIALAQKLDKPLIIHCRDAHEDMLAMLPAHRGVIHSFTGTLQQALLYIERGYHIGFNGIITFSRDYDEVIRGIPVEKIVVETDSPYLTPTPYRGKRNEPVYVEEVIFSLSYILKIDKDILKEIIKDNTNKLFRISL